MKKICLNNRDEMIMLFVDNIAYIMAKDLYVRVFVGSLSLANFLLNFLPFVGIIMFRRFPSFSP